MKPCFFQRILLLGSLLTAHLGLWAQLPPNQPEQDCINALSVCQDIFVQSNSYVGEGLNPDEIDLVPSCLDSGEKNDVWYIFTVQTSGELSFTITPNNLADDYDWAVYDLTNASCEDIFTNPDLEVSCNWSFVSGQTGPNGQGPGGFFDPFNPTIPVQAGEVYVVNVSNFSSTNFGYVLDFSTSTAQIFDNIPPQMEVGGSCIGGNIPISFSENVQCATVDASDFVVNGPNGPYTITEVSSSACQAGGGFERDFELVISPALTAGTYQVSLTGSVLDICGNEAILSTDSLQIDDISAAFSMDLPAVCQDSCITFSLNDNPDPTYTYLWDFGPNAFPATSPLPNPTCITFSQGGVQTISLTVSVGACSVSETKTVEIYSTPLVDAGPAKFICEGESGVQLEGNVSNGSPDFSYQWSCNLPNEADCGISDPNIPNPSVVPQLAPNDTATYYLLVTDANGCVSNVDSVHVQLGASPKADAGPDRRICAIGPGKFLDGGPAPDNQAPGPFLYQWTPADGLSEDNAANPFARPEQTTTYTLVITAGNGCSSNPSLDTNSQVTVFVDSLPVAEAGTDTVICKGDTIQLHGSATVTGPDFDYVWTPANTGFMSDPNAADPLVSPNFTTLYFLVATSRSTGCPSLADSVRVTVSSTPTVSAGPNQSQCLGDSTQLQGSALGDPDATLFSYQWTPATGLSNPHIRNPLASPDTTTLYTLMATSNFGCGSNSASTLLTVKSTPIAEATSRDTLICEGDMIQLSATARFTTTPPAPVTYLWRPSTGIVGSANQAEIVVAPVASTSYWVTASISGDCPTTDTVFVEVSPTFEATASADTAEICSGQSVQLHASGGFGSASYQWMPAASVNNPAAPDPIATPDTTTTYLVVVSEGACEDTVAVPVKVNPTPTSDYFTSEPNGCVGLSVSFFENSQNAIAYIWDFGDGSPVSNEANPVHVYEQPGSYSVRLTTVGLAGCSSSSATTTVNIAEPVQAQFSASPSPATPIYMPGANIQFTDMSANALQWLWDFGDGSGSAETSPAHTYTQAGSYEVTLTVTGENGCIDRFSLGPFDILAPQLFIPNVFSPNGDGINDAFEVRYQGAERFFMEIFDRWGNQYFEAQNTSDTWNGLAPSGEPATEGVYYYHVRIGDKSYMGDLTLMR